MKKFTMFLTLMGLFSAANAADIRIFYAPWCPHCHHARDFIKNELIYEYNDLKVVEIDATVKENTPKFRDALVQCKYTSGGVPVLVIGDKCFQGYGEQAKTDIRAAIEIDLSDAQKKSANDNRAELKKNHDAFVAAHADRQNAIVSQGDAKKN